MRLIDADRFEKEVMEKCGDNPAMFHYFSEVCGIARMQPTIEIHQWIPCSERLPEEYLCKDGEYDPSDKVLCQLSNGDMKSSRYWNHRHCKDTIIIQPWFDLKDWHEVIAWMPLPQAYTGKEPD